MQREISALGEPRKLKNVSEELLRMCDDELDAVRLCIQLSSLTNEYIGKQLAIDKGHFSRIMSGSVGFPTHKRLKLMRLCGNRAPVQYEVMQIGLGDIDETTVDAKVENAALKEKIAALEGALAAMLNSPRAA
ncbi:hypothetical protein [Paraburkholderia caledonica]|uniref:XRE family transcriptional regulator n=1 Tax=Paraburkholderia caledonica TaxID=134536 RepID=A0AB73IPH6_9BURK|nr:hypothetical protein [Paraburkholderia caledonica]